MGSYNLDPCSAYLDTELLLVIDSEAFAAQMRQVQDGYCEQALEVEQDGSYGAHTPERQVSLGKRLLLMLLFLPVRLLRPLT